MHLFPKQDCLGQETCTLEAHDLTFLQTNPPSVDASDGKFDGKFDDSKRITFEATCLFLTRNLLEH